jgi:pyruvate,water dikinase
MNKYIMYFDEIDRKDVSKAGGKGANLGEMTKAGFNVPFGFCVTTDGYKEFLKLNCLEEPITRLVMDAGIENVSEIGTKIRKFIIESKVPDELLQEISKAIDKTGADNYYAVRSSATAEDLGSASFAGQQDTYLNIKGVNDIVGSVRKCWASLFTDRAILYRVKNNVDHEKVYMSVVVQKMVLPSVSGILFTADPVSGHRGILSIDAGYGLGEALVSGIVSPDIYKYDKKTGQITEKMIAEKKLAFMPLSGGGTEKIQVPAEKVKSQVLPDMHIKKLAELGMAIERHYGCPQDIEWCIKDDKLFIVQSRAITSLFPLPEPLPDDEALHAYASFNHFQVMTDPISPLGIDMLRMISNFDSGARSYDEYRFLKSAAGRVYLDISIILERKRFAKMFASFMNNADGLFAVALKDLINRPEFKIRIKKDAKKGKALNRFIIPIIFKALANLAFRKPEGTIPFIDRYIQERVEKAKEAIAISKPGIERLEAIFREASFTEDFRAILPKMAPAMLSFKILGNLEEKLLASHTCTDLIVKGLEGNITTEMGLLTGDLADEARKSDAVLKELENEDYRTLFDRIDRLDGCDEFKKKLDSFMEIYDMRGAGEIDISRDRWIENPEPLAKVILSIAKTSSEGIHRIEFRETVEKAESAALELIREVDEKHGLLKGKIVKRAIRVLRNYLPMREHPKYLIMKLMLIFKRALLDEAKILVQKGQLENERDIFYVGFWELYKAIQNDESLLQLVEERKEEYKHFSNLAAPRLITSDGEEIKGSYKRENLPEGALVGMAASSGVIEGIAKVVMNPSETSLSKGEILVAPFTDPGWTPLFINAAGLVTEIGGLLTHGTVVAREYGMPAVVGVTDATKRIKTGQKIKVDGNNGFVVLL